MIQAVEVKVAGGKINHYFEVLKRFVASSSCLCGLHHRIQSFKDSVIYLVGLPADDSIPVTFDCHRGFDHMCEF